MTGQQRAYWFPAKRYGWGWGPPRVWQGWVVLIGFMLLTAACAALLMPAHVLAFAACMAVLIALLLPIMWRKGEPPHWRWGGK